MAETTQNSVELEIKELEKVLEEKRRALAEKGETQEHKETFREVYREKYAGPQEIPNITPPIVQPQAATHDPAAQKREEELKKRSREEQLNALIQISFEKGIRSAVSMAKQSTPWLIDELHDRLIDEYYQKLIQAHQITGSP